MTLNHDNRGASIQSAPIEINYSNEESDVNDANCGPVVDPGPPSQFHTAVIRRLTDFDREELQAIFFEVEERGPPSLVEPIKGEFERRGLFPQATCAGQNRNDSAGYDIP